MAYTTSGLVSAIDYNALAAQLRAQWGVGSGVHGFGQSITPIADVAAGTTVTATQWTGLLATTNACLTHEGQPAITPTSVTAGTPITYFASLTSGTASAYNNTGVSGIALSDSAANVASYPSAWGTTASRSLEFTHTVTFASADAARYFFNAGGRLKLSFSKSGGTATSRNAEWAALAAACGSIQLRANANIVKVGGSGTVSDLGPAGYYALTTSPVRYFLQYDGEASYSSNYITTNIWWSGTSSNGGYQTVNFQTIWANVWVNAYQDAVDGITATNLVVASPSTSYLANTWGTPSVTNSVTLI